jgi:uncharacterized protein
VLVTGARQVGKTTLLRHCFASTHTFVSFDLPEMEELATRDPRLFLERYPSPVVLDEIQRVPTLLRYVKEQVDRRRELPGQYLLTGSQVFPLMAGVTESLAGRVAVLALDTLSAGEEDGRGSVWSVPPRVLAPDADPRAPISLRMLRGGFPELWVRAEGRPTLWFESYLQTYLERDVRQLRQVGDLRDFRRLMVALAARAGQLLNLSELARDLGAAVNTVKAWVSVLEASHQVHLLAPFHRNLTKRLVKSPKLYFSDTGLLCHLLGLRDDESVLVGAAGGAVFENLVHGELRRACTARGLTPDLTFFRSSDGLEVDFLVREGGRYTPVEVKRAATPRREMADGIERLRALLGDELAPGLVIRLGEPSPLPLTANVDAVGFDGVG